MTKRLTAGLLLIASLAATTADGAPEATGPRSSYDPSTGARSFSIGGDIENYDSAGTWRPIQGDWEIVDSGLQVTRGAYSAYIDTANGEIWYGYKGHYVGLEPLRLIWFRPADSTWTTIANATIDSFEVSGNTVTAPDPFGLGVELNYAYHPGQFFQGYAYTPAARDTLKKLYQAEGDNTLWLANVIRLDLSRTNASMKKLGAIFGGGDLGDDDYLDIEMDSASIAYQPTVLEWTNPDFLTQDFYKLKRRVVNIAGTWYLVELINPRKVDTLNGTLIHQASIVLQRTEDAVSGASLYGGQRTSIGGTYFGHQNRGASTAIEIGYRYYTSVPLPEFGALRFDNLTDTLSARGILPHWVDSARLDLWNVTGASIDTAYAMIRILEYWVEGTENGTAINGVSSHYRSDDDFSTTRTTIGAIDTLWTGYEADTIWSNWLGGFPLAATFDDSNTCCTGTGVFSLGENTSMTALVNTIRLWMNYPDSNFGWLITQQQVDGISDHYTYFRSDDYTTASQTPKLEIFYTDRGPLYVPQKRKRKG